MPANPTGPSAPPTCPFCGDDGDPAHGGGYDLTGLKGHILNDCAVFDDTETPVQEMLRKRKEPR